MGFDQSIDITKKKKREKRRFESNGSNRANETKARKKHAIVDLFIIYTYEMQLAF